MELTKCIHCGHKVSSEASICPKCNEKPRPYGHCMICDNPINQKKDIFESKYGDGIRFWHVNCVKQISTEDDVKHFLCPVCNTKLSYADYVIPPSSISINTPCNQCGHPLLLMRCAVCMNPIVCNGKIGVVGRSNLLAHKLCGNMLKESWRRSGSCIDCGRTIEQRVTIFELLFKPKRCESCR